MKLFKPFWITAGKKKDNNWEEKRTGLVEKIGRIADGEKLVRIANETDDRVLRLAAVSNPALTDWETLLTIACGGDAPCALAAVKKLTDEKDLLWAALNNTQDDLYPSLDTAWDEIPENVAADRLGEQEDLLEVALRANHTTNYIWYSAETWARMAENIAAGRLTAEADIERVAKDARSWYARYVAAARMTDREKAIDILFTYRPTDDTKDMALEFIDNNDPRLVELVKECGSSQIFLKRRALKKITDESLLLDIFADERSGGNLWHSEIDVGRFTPERCLSLISEGEDERLCRAMFIELESGRTYALPDDSETIRKIARGAASGKVRAWAERLLEFRKNTQSAHDCVSKSARAEELQKAVLKEASDIWDIKPLGEDTAAALILLLERKYARYMDAKATHERCGTDLTFAIENEKAIDYNLTAGGVLIYLKELYETVPGAKEIVDSCGLQAFNAPECYYTYDEDRQDYETYPEVNFEFGSSAAEN